MYDIQFYQKAENIKHAVELLQIYPQATLIAGGTDLLVKLRNFDKSATHLIDIHGLSELQTIAYYADGTIFIGAGTTFSQLIDSTIIQQHLPILVQAAKSIAGPQIRNVATYGGNICNGATSADSAAASLVLDPDLVIISPTGEYTRPLQGFHLAPGKVDLKPAELLKGFRFYAENYHHFGMRYIKYALRDAMDIATIGCATACKITDGHFVQVKLALNVAAPTPIRCIAAERCAQGLPLTQASINKINQSIEKDISPRTSWRANSNFRSHIIKVLTERAIISSLKQLGEDIHE